MIKVLSRYFLNQVEVRSVQFRKFCGTFCKMIATTGAAIPNRVNNNNRLCQADRLCLVSIIRHEEETGEWRRGEARRELNGQKCSSLKSWPPFCFTSSQFYFFRFFLPVVDGRRPDNWNILRVSIYYQFSAVQLSFRVMTLTQ